MRRTAGIQFVAAVLATVAVGVLAVFLPSLRLTDGMDHAQPPENLGVVDEQEKIQATDEQMHEILGRKFEYGDGGIIRQSTGRTLSASERMEITRTLGFQLELLVEYGVFPEELLEMSSEYEAVIEELQYTEDIYTFTVWRISVNVEGLVNLEFNMHQETGKLLLMYQRYGGLMADHFTINETGPYMDVLGNLTDDDLYRGWGRYITEDAEVFVSELPFSDTGKNERGEFDHVSFVRYLLEGQREVSYRFGWALDGTGYILYIWPSVGG